MSFIIKAISPLVLALFMSACGGGGSSSNDTTTTNTNMDIGGKIEKGPFLPGGTITAQYIDSMGQKTGPIYTGTITSDLGDYTINLPTPGTVHITATGLYFDELTGAPSSAPITLTAVHSTQDNSDSTTDTPVNINLLTHVISKRVTQLISEGETYDVSNNTAQLELLAELSIAFPSTTNNANFSALKLFNDQAELNAEGNAFLLATTVAIYQYSLDQVTNNTYSTVDEALNASLADFKDDGILNTTNLGQALPGVVSTIDPQAITNNLTNLLGNNSNSSIADINQALDSDFDGVTNNIDDDDDNDGIPDIQDNNPTLAGVTWYFDNDGDGYGDASRTIDVGTQPSGYVANSTDCNDSVNAINPGSSEVLGNNIDDNCDGRTDEGLLAFISSGLTFGNIGSGGINGADEVCQLIADQANLPRGVYKAWVSSSTEAVKDRFSQSDQPYFFPNGKLLANSWNDLVTQNFAFSFGTGNGFDIDENGMQVSSSQPVWTNTTSDGSIANSVSTNHCNDWTEGNSGTGLVGFNDQNSNEDWTVSTTASCNSSARLYCFQQEAVSAGGDFVEFVPGCAFGGNPVNYGIDNGDGNGTPNNGILETGETDVTYSNCVVKGAGKYQIEQFAFNQDGARANCEAKGLVLATWDNQQELEDVIAACHSLGPCPTQCPNNDPFCVPTCPDCYTQYKVSDNPVGNAASDLVSIYSNSITMPDAQNAFGYWEVGYPYSGAGEAVFVRRSTSTPQEPLLYHRTNIGYPICMAD